MLADIISIFYRKCEYCLSMNKLKKEQTTFFYNHQSQCDNLISQNLCTPPRVCMLNFVGLCVTPWTVAHQVLLSTGFPRQEYWNGLPFPPPGDLPDSGIELASPSASEFTGGHFTVEPPGKSIPLVYPLENTGHTAFRDAKRLCLKGSGISLALTRL